MQRPNILYIHSHDTGRYIQPYGHAIATPNLQKLAEGGVLFRQCYCAGPTCSARRAALLTGQYPHQNGMVGLAHKNFSMNDYGRHLAVFLKQAGYATALFGIQHEIHWSRIDELAYGKVVREKEPFTEAAADFLLNPPRQPFFMSVGFRETHREFGPPEPADDERYTAPPLSLPDVFIKIRKTAGGARPTG